MSSIEQWSLIFDCDIYKAPECQNIIPRLDGYVFSHDKQPNGRRVVTSRLIYFNIQERMAQTRNTCYILGEPSQDFIKYLMDNGYTLEQYNFDKRTIDDIKEY